MFLRRSGERGSKEDAIACVKMAIAMQRRMQELQRKWLDLGSQKPFELRVGINTGFCTVGNFGSEGRMDYTIIGNEVNLAARLQTQAELGGILVTHETCSLIKDTILTEEQEAVSVKGLAQPVRACRVVGICDELEKDRRISKLIGATQGPTRFAEARENAAKMKAARVS
jgi:adenylate cyclase